MKGYPSGMRRDRVTILNRKEAVLGKYGLDGGGAEWEKTMSTMASVEWTKGKSALREGATDAYGVVMVRMLYTPCVTMRSRIIHNGQTYQILPETFHADKFANTVQFLAQVIINDKP
jgi:head-tail adaptor